MRRAIVMTQGESRALGDARNTAETAGMISTQRADRRNCATTRRLHVSGV